MRIDAHQHFWQVARGDYGWLKPELAAIYRDFMPADLVPLIEAADIERTILVQAAPTLAETEFLLRLAAHTPFVAGVVGWVDFAAADAAATIARLAADPLLVGLRPMVQDIADPDWLLDTRFNPAFRALVKHGLVFDALVKPIHLPRLKRLIERHPELAVVIDHGAKPAIAARTLDPWRNDLTALAAHPTVACKLSGLVTEAAPTWTTADLAPYAAHLLACFGPRRLIWGSDWPVLNLAGDYARWQASTEALLSGLNESERTAILGGNAARVYLTSRGRG